MTRENEKKFIQRHVNNIERALQEYPKTAGHAYLRGKQQAFREVLEMFSGTYDNCEIDL